MTSKQAFELGRRLGMAKSAIELQSPVYKTDKGIGLRSPVVPKEKPAPATTPAEDPMATVFGPGYKQMLEQATPDKPVAFAYATDPSGKVTRSVSQVGRREPAPQRTEWTGGIVPGTQTRMNPRGVRWERPPSDVEENIQRAHLRGQPGGETAAWRQSALRKGFIPGGTGMTVPVSGMVPPSAFAQHMMAGEPMGSTPSGRQQLQQSIQRTAPDIRQFISPGVLQAAEPVMYAGLQGMNPYMLGQRLGSQGLYTA